MAWPSKKFQVRIPDDQSSRTQFAIIDDELEEQLRDILESNETIDESTVFKMARYVQEHNIAQQ